MDTTSIGDQLAEQVEALEQTDPAEAVGPAERLAEELEERLDREADAAQAS